jgi:hypothetical protein
MPRSEGIEQEVVGVDIHPAGLLHPAPEGIPWFVLKTPLEISPE